MGMDLDERSTRRKNVASIHIKKYCGPEGDFEPKDVSVETHNDNTLDPQVPPCTLR